MTRNALALAWLLSASACVTKGGLIHDFSYTAEEGPIQNFSFSFVTPGFLAPGPLTFEPFSITDGVHTWVITQGYASLIAGPGEGCLMFGTAANAVVGPCGVAGQTAPPDGALFMTLYPGGLPGALGLQSSYAGTGGFFAWYDPILVQNMNLQVNISQESGVPEPGSLALLLTGLSVGIWLRRRNAPGGDSPN